MLSLDTCILGGRVRVARPAGRKFGIDNTSSEIVVCVLHAFPTIGLGQVSTLVTPFYQVTKLQKVLQVRPFDAFPVIVIFATLLLRKVYYSRQCGFPRKGPPSGS